jgi:hypothetical protein
MMTRKKSVCVQKSCNFFLIFSIQSWLSSEMWSPDGEKAIVLFRGHRPYLPLWPCSLLSAARSSFLKVPSTSVLFMRQWIFGGTLIHFVERMWPDKGLRARALGSVANADLHFSSQWITRCGFPPVCLCALAFYHWTAWDSPFLMEFAGGGQGLPPTNSQEAWKEQSHPCAAKSFNL